MPVYEYQCLDCNRRFSRFFWRLSDSDNAECRCGSGRLEQLVSRVSMPRSEEARLNQMADPAHLGGLDENDPRAMARMMREIGGEAGEDLGPEFGEVVDRLEAGEDPESIESSMDMDGGSDSDNLF